MAVIESKGDGYALYNGAKVLASEVPDGAEAIPLDGMNVIEWDGDTTGLEQFPTNAFAWYIPNHSDVDINREVINVRYRHNDGKITVYNKVATENTGYYQHQCGFYVESASETYPTTGLYLVANDAYYVMLFAYYPIEEEPEEPDGESISFIEYLVKPKYRRYPFRGFFGWLMVRNK